MPEQPSIHIEQPFIVFLGDVADETYAKTGLGLVHWRREGCLGQLRLPGSTVDAGVPDLSITQAKAAGARSLIFGVAPVGGGMPEHWLPVLCEAAAAGIDVVAGLHLRLESLPGLARAAAQGQARLVDIRVPPPGLPVGTGQTGIMIAGQGLPIDAVVSDFVTGAAETLSPDNDADHWDMVEGQGPSSTPASCRSRSACSWARSRTRSSSATTRCARTSPAGRMYPCDPSRRSSSAPCRSAA